MNGSNKQAYDRGTSLFSPDGHIYQVEYAREAVGRGAPVVGVRGADAVALAAKARSPSSLMERESVEKLFRLDEHIGAASAGHVGDARRLVDFARQRAQRERLRYGEPIGASELATEIGDFVQESTQSGGTRPFGAALLLAGVDDGPSLYEVGPSGAPREWAALAIGSGRAEIEEFLEDEYAEGLSADESVTLALRALAVSGEFDAEEVTVAVVDDDGYRRLVPEEVEAALENVDFDEADDAGADDVGDGPDSPGE